MSTLSQFLGAGPGTTFAKTMPSWTGSGRLIDRYTVGHTGLFKNAPPLAFPNTAGTGTYGAAYGGSGQNYLVVNTPTTGIFHVNMATNPPTWVNRNAAFNGGNGSFPTSNEPPKRFANAVWLAAGGGIDRCAYTTDNGVTWTHVGSYNGIDIVGSRIYLTSGSSIVSYNTSFTLFNPTSPGGSIYKVFGNDTRQFAITSAGVYVSTNHGATAWTVDTNMNDWILQNGGFQNGGVLPNGTGIILTAQGAIGIINMTTGAISSGANLRNFIGGTPAFQAGIASARVGRDLVSYVDSDGVSHFCYDMMELVAMDSGAYYYNPKKYWCTTVDGTFASANLAIVSTASSPNIFPNYFLATTIIDLGIPIIGHRDSSIEGFKTPNLDSKEIYYEV